MKPELLIWDWNGTILDDVQLCFDIANIMLWERGIPTLPDLQAYRSVFGFPIKAYYEKMGYRFGPEDETYAAVSDEFVAIYEQGYRLCPLRKGAGESLSRLGRVYPQVLLSATKADQLVTQVSAFGSVGTHFQKLLGLSDHYAFSQAALAKGCIATRGLAPAAALFIGDTDHDDEVSSAIGCPCVLLTGGHQSRERLEKTGAPVLDSLLELENYLELA